MDLWLIIDYVGWCLILPSNGLIGDRSGAGFTKPLHLTKAGLSDWRMHFSYALVRKSSFSKAQGRCETGSWWWTFLQIQLCRLFCNHRHTTTCIILYYIIIYSNNVVYLLPIHNLCCSLYRLTCQCLLSFQVFEDGEIDPILPAAAGSQVCGSLSSPINTL